MNMTQNNESIVFVAKEVVERSNGLSLDIGGSAIKVAYRHKDDLEEFLQESKTAELAKVRLCIFPKEEIERAIEYVLNNCHISRKHNDLPYIYITGTGSIQHKGLIEKQLKVRTKTMWEMDGFVKAFVTLSHCLPKQDFIHVLSDKRRKELHFIMEKTLNIYKHVNQVTQKTSSVMRPLKVNEIELELSDPEIISNQPIVTTLPNMYPCLMYAVCSNAAFILIKGENDYELITPFNNGGRSFLGLGSLLCGSKKSYDDLVDMATNGDNTRVDQTLKSLQRTRMAENQQQNVYSDLIEGDIYDNPLYVFGQAASKSPESFSKEDIIRSLLVKLCRDHVFGMFPTIMARNVRQVFGVGSFFNRELVRTIFHNEFVHKQIGTAVGSGKKVMEPQLHFVKMGGSLGCLGAFMCNPDTRGRHSNE